MPTFVFAVYEFCFSRKVEIDSNWLNSCGGYKITAIM